jgi:hypothetical protein
MHEQRWRRKWKKNEARKLDRDVPLLAGSVGNLQDFGNDFVCLWMRVGRGRREAEGDGQVIWSDEERVYGIRIVRMAHSDGSVYVPRPGTFAISSRFSTASLVSIWTMTKTLSFAVLR